VPTHKKEIIHTGWSLFLFFADGNGLHPTLAVPERRCARYRSAPFDRGAKPCSLYPPPAALAGFAHPEHGRRVAGASRTCRKAVYFGAFWPFGFRNMVFFS